MSVRGKAELRVTLTDAIQTIGEMKRMAHRVEARLERLLDVAFEELDEDSAEQFRWALQTIRGSGGVTYDLEEVSGCLKWARRGAQGQW